MTSISADGLSKQYRIGQLDAGYGTLRESIVHATRRVFGREPRHDDQERTFWALRNVSFAVEEGSVVGIIGRNGAGKSTLLKVLTRITTPTEGYAEIRGRVGSLLEVGTGFHPELTGRENVFLNGSILGMRRREITQKLPDIIEFAGIERFMDTPVKRYSSGMYVRLAFSVAAHLEPEILLVDEVLAVGDAEFQKRCLGRMEELGNSGRTVLLVSHNMQAIAQLCDRAIWLEKGLVVEDGLSSELVANYLQSGHGTGASQSWAEDDAPGDDLVRLRYARVVQDGEEAPAVDVRHPVGIEVGFAVLRDGGPPIFPKIKLVDQRGDVAFNAMDTSARWLEITPPGEYVSTAWIPGNLLNEGLIDVQFGIASLAAPKLLPHTGANVSFHVQDFGEGDSAKGLFTGQWKGVVRPLLDWTTEEV